MEAVRVQTAQAATQLYQLAGPEWQAFLTLPPEIFRGGPAPTPEAVDQGSPASRPSATIRATARSPSSRSSSPRIRYCGNMPRHRGNRPHRWLYPVRLLERR